MLVGMPELEAAYLASCFCYSPPSTTKEVSEETGYFRQTEQFTEDAEFQPGMTHGSLFLGQPFNGSRDSPRSYTLATSFRHAAQGSVSFISNCMSISVALRFAGAMFQIPPGLCSVQILHHVTSAAKDAFLPHIYREPCRGPIKSSFEAVWAEKDSVASISGRSPPIPTAARVQG
ncbi:hypothetical protein BU23DRAFT_570803 [Bimuria novae-zelandiae CBS 107.79]|uniref:Uncharacterized protein n=1 Tax=Bimuria novae-zelandiae CBS 107.79 TaxID=1447943 RepID=A0A6A5UZI3_9PLEO|nr:hypothetical protein BU23DRAFT_570803 [Bimuria novae-zelandiae CBS 107.79]